VHEGRQGYSVKIGGGLSSVPRIGRDLGVFVPAEEAIEFLEAATGVWSDDLRYRVSRVKARMKFMVDDVGAAGMRELIETRLGRALEDYELAPLDTAPGDHLGVHAQKQPGLSYIGVPVKLGLLTGDQLIAVANLADELGGDVRITRQQNFVLTGVPDERLDEALGRLAEIGFTLDVNGVWGSSIGCTGEPHCNFSVGETKTRLGRLLAHLEETFGDDVAGLRLNLDGCPHSCAQHWIGDLGFQGTTGKDDGGHRLSAYDIFVRGGLAPEPAIGRPLFRRVASEKLEGAVEGLVRGWLDGRGDGESFTEFQRRLSDEELGALAGLEPARSRREEAIA
jgi:ferredoxin-nitrite reductase